MDHFERELARMMRDAHEHTPFGPAQQDGLRSGVRGRRRIRAAQKAAGSVLAVAGISVGLFLMPHARDQERPQAPLPRPATTPTSPAVTPTPTLSPSETPTGSATSTAEDGAGTSVTPDSPTAPESSTSGGADPTGGPTTSPPATTPVPPSGTQSTATSNVTSSYVAGTHGTE